MRDSTNYLTPATQRQRETFNTGQAGGADPVKKKGDFNSKIVQLYMKGDKGVKKSKYETSVRAEKARTAHI